MATRAGLMRAEVLRGDGEQNLVALMCPQRPELKMLGSCGDPPGSRKRCSQNEMSSRFDAANVL